MIFVTTDRTFRAGQTSPVVCVAEVQLQLMARPSKRTAAAVSFYKRGLQSIR
jgi:hypothetical protein